MKVFYIIQDINSKEFYWEWNGSNGFIENIVESTEYKTENEAIEGLSRYDDYLDEEVRTLEIKKFFQV